MGKTLNGTTRTFATKKVHIWLLQLVVRLLRLSRIEGCQQAVLPLLLLLHLWWIYWGGPILFFFTCVCLFKAASQFCSALSSTTLASNPGMQSFLKIISHLCFLGVLLHLLRVSIYAEESWQLKSACSKTETNPKNNKGSSTKSCGQRRSLADSWHPADGVRNLVILPVIVYQDDFGWKIPGWYWLTYGWGSGESWKATSLSTNAVSTKQPRMPKPSQVKISKLWSQCFHLFGLVTKFETFHWIRNSTLCPNPFIFLLRLSFMESLGFLKDFLHVSFHPGSWTGRTSCLFGDWSTSVSLEQVAPPWPLWRNLYTTRVTLL